MARPSSLLCASGAYRTEWRRLFVRLLQTTLRTEVASHCGVTVQAVGQWAAGKTRPDIDSAYIVQKRYGILMTALAEPATTDESNAFTEPVTLDLPPQNAAHVHNTRF